MKYKKVVLCIREINMQEYGVLSLKLNYGKNDLLYSSEHQAKSINGVVIVVEENRKVSFEPIPDQICKITIELIKSDSKIIIISIYGPRLKCSEKDPELLMLSITS